MLQNWREETMLQSWREEKRCYRVGERRNSVAELERGETWLTHLPRYCVQSNSIHLGYFTVAFLLGVPINTLNVLG